MSMEFIRVVRKEAEKEGVISGRLQAFQEASVELSNESTEISALISNPREASAVFLALQKLALKIIAKR